MEGARRGRRGSERGVFGQRVETLGFHGLDGWDLAHFGLFFLTWWIIAFDGSTYDPTLIGKLYRGYSISPAGSLIGFVWALVDGLILGAVFAWLYNTVAARTSVREVN